MSDSLSLALKRRAFVLLAILLAMRVLWVPAHLASEPHGEVAQQAAHSHDIGEHHDHDPAPDRDSHDDEHPPHSAADHLTSLISSRIDLDGDVVLLPVRDWISVAELPLTAQRVAIRPAETVPKAAPPRPSLARAPPVG